MDGFVLVDVPVEPYCWHSHLPGEISPTVVRPGKDAEVAVYSR